MNNFGGIFWCRGNSWFTLGILDYVDMFKGTLNSGVKEIIIDAYKAQTAALKKLQSKSGLWHTVLTDSSSYEEVSGSAAITAGILKGIRMGILDDSYIDVADKAINAILKILIQMEQCLMYLEELVWDMMQSIIRTYL